MLRWFRTPPLSRWQMIARQYRSLALEMGGVLIKLGQFLSIRVDILPDEVTSELVGLQDEVPPEPVEAVISQIEEDFSGPLSQIFEQFSLEPVGAASLAQAHLAVIRDMDTNTCREVVVKVLRPGIDVIVETDLKAIRLAFRWLKYYKRVSQRVDLDWLAQEFTTVTRNELDFDTECRNARHLARDFADDPHVYIPEIYDDYCAARTLTLENVGYIKISDSGAMEAAGIHQHQVADTLYNLYMKQVFETWFVHVDPHPGNLFVRPLPHTDEIAAGITNFVPGQPVPCKPGRQFQIVFVDFGMAVTIPERLRDALREYAVGVGTRDARKIVQALANAGALLPGADLKRLEEVHEVFFKRLWGIRAGQFRGMALDEARHFFKEYKDVIYEAPLQFQVDMLFVVRAVGILSGMAARLDPDFDVWEKTIPYAERYAREELQKNWREWFRQITGLSQALFRLPEQLDEVLSQFQQEKITVRTGLAADTRNEIRRLEKSVNRLSQTLFGVGLLISGVILYTDNTRITGSVFMGLAFVMLFLGTRKS